MTTGDTRVLPSTDTGGSAPSARVASEETLVRHWPRLRAELVGAAASAGMALVLAAAVLRLWRAHLNVPFVAAGDTMLGLMVVKNMQTTGWYQGSPGLGAPFGQNLAGYPFAVGDLWNMVTLKALSLFLTPAASVNVFFVLGFPAIAVVAYGCLRLLGISRPLACVLGVLYAILPYHFLRNESHLFLSAYFAVPVACVLALSIYGDRLTVWAHPRRLPRAAWVALAGAALLSGTGLYYAAFAMVLLAAGGVLGSLSMRNWRPLVSSTILLGVIGSGLVLAALPNLLHTGPAGTGIEGRSFGATEFYGLKITNLLLPLANHRVPALAQLQVPTADTPIPGEGSATLGILGVAGLVAILMAVLQPVARNRSHLVGRLRPLGVMALVALLTGTVSGLNSMFAVFGFADLRAWNRISVVIAFLALAGLGLVLDAFQSRYFRDRLPARRLLVGGLAAGVLVAGSYDQTSPQMVPDFAGATTAWNSDAAYFAKVESALGAESAVFALPYARFPENPPIVNMSDYSHLRGYLHSSLRWNYGGVKNEESEWQPVALRAGTSAALPSLVSVGFDAVYVNRAGYADAGAAVEAEIAIAIGNSTPLVNPEGTLAIYDLRPYAAGLEESGVAVPSHDSVLYPVQVTYDDGFYGEEAAGTDRWQWAQGSAAMTLINPGPTPVKVVLSGVVQVADAAATVSIRVGDDETRPRSQNGLAELEIPVTAEPGATAITFTTNSFPTLSTPADTRDLRQRVINFTVVRQDAVE